MTTPAANTPNAIINDAYFDAGKLQQGQNASSEQLASGMRRLKDLINFFGTQGLKLWVNVDTNVPLVANQATYTFGPTGDVVMVKPLRVLEGYYLYSATNVRRPLTPLSWNDYLMLGQAGTLASNLGTVTQYFVNKQDTSLPVTLWQCPDTTEAANGSVHLLLQAQITNPDMLTETMQFPQEWRMALRWGLANELSTGQPESVIARCEKWAQFYRTALEDWDVEDAPTSFQPDQRAQGNYGQFR